MDTPECAPGGLGRPKTRGEVAPIKAKWEFVSSTGVITSVANNGCVMRTFTKGCSIQELVEYTTSEEFKRKNT